jgi:hypothetical protein
MRQRGIPGPPPMLGCETESVECVSLKLRFIFLGIDSGIGFCAHGGIALCRHGVLGEERNVCDFLSSLSRKMSVPPEF